MRYLVGFLLHKKELFKFKKRKFGKIRMLRGYFQKLKEHNFKVDAVVSLSAIEHCDLDQIEDSLQGFFSILKKNGLVLLTTSVTDSEENKFEDYFKGWSFCKKALRDIFYIKVSNKEIKKNYDLIEKSKLFWENVDPYYFEKKNSYFHRKLYKKVPYVPIGITYTTNNKD